MSVCVYISHAKDVICHNNHGEKALIMNQSDSMNETNHHFPGKSLSRVQVELTAINYKISLMRGLLPFLFSQISIYVVAWKNWLEKSLDRL